MMTIDNQNRPVIKALLSNHGDSRMLYYIENKEGLWWSNTDGWCDNTRSLFNQNEKETFNLPMGGEWKELVQ